LGAVWARARLRDLEDRYAIGEGRLHDLEKTIVATSLTFNVLCRFTAYVAVDHEQVVNPGGNLHQAIQPVESPQGWAMPASAPPVYGMAPELGQVRMSLAADYDDSVAHFEVCEERITHSPSPASRSSRKASQGMPAIDIEAILDRLRQILSEGPTGDEDTLEQILTDLQQVALWLAPQRKRSALRKEAGAVIQSLTALYDEAPVSADEVQEPWARALALVDACVAVVNGIEPPTQPKGRGRSFWK
jgi:hypothetical protein